MNTTIMSMTVRALLGRRRFLLLAPLPILLVGLAALADGLGEHPGEWGGPVIVGLGFGAVLPVVALIVGTAVIGAEIDDGTVVHLLTKPVPRTEIVLSKLTVGVGVTTATVAVPMVLAGLIAGSARLALGLAVGSALGALAYSAVFLALSLMTRRPVLVGLVYVLIWEGLLGNLLSGTKLLSIQQHTIAVSDRIAMSDDVLNAALSTPVAVATSLAFVVGATYLAIDRLRSFSIAGETG
jgi:ABC-2 type transport system permease protein